jgi:F-type H+-transporting ATPase subunit c
MNSKFLAMVAIGMILLGCTSMAFAAPAAAGADSPNGALLTDIGAGRLGGPIGAGLVLIGGGMGIGKVAASACEAIARQPEAGGRIFTSMIIAAAIIEGTTLFGVVVCLLPVIK